MIDKTPADEELRAMVMGNCTDVVEAAYVGPMSWLDSALEVLENREVAKIGQGDDADSYWEMVREVRALHAAGMKAFMRLASRDPEFVAAQMALQLPRKDHEPSTEPEMIPF